MDQSKLPETLMRSGMFPLLMTVALVCYAVPAALAESTAGSISDAVKKADASSSGDKSAGKGDKTAGASGKDSKPAHGGPQVQPREAIQPIQAVQARESTQPRP